ncbi:hypothetical protein BC940DRAFT_167299 [Gongronella butleri]|nr:hypothetical protein BC940DRAFT_167299 [Gongronella butleri]
MQPIPADCNPPNATRGQKVPKKKVEKHNKKTSVFVRHSSFCRTIAFCDYIGYLVEHTLMHVAQAHADHLCGGDLLTRTDPQQVGITCNLLGSAQYIFCNVRVLDRAEVSPPYDMLSIQEHKWLCGALRKWQWSRGFLCPTARICHERRTCCPRRPHRRTLCLITEIVRNHPCAAQMSASTRVWASARVLPS